VVSPPFFSAKTTVSPASANLARDYERKVPAHTAPPRPQVIDRASHTPRPILTSSRTPRPELISAKTPRPILSPPPTPKAPRPGLSGLSPYKPKKP
jgi:hypothetical protein